MADELRRAYHDRIADLRSQTITVVRVAAASLGNVAPALLTRDLATAAAVLDEVRQAEVCAAQVESEVVDLLAQQAPVARDLRLILSSLRISQIGELCLGLVRTLASKVGRGDEVLTPSLQALLRSIGASTAELLDLANQAWIGLDEALSHAVVESAEQCRSLQRQFLAELIGLHEVPVEVGVDLGMTARAFERLTDHAVEIAARVVFAATGATVIAG